MEGSKTMGSYFSSERKPTSWLNTDKNSLATKRLGYEKLLFIAGQHRKKKLDNNVNASARQLVSFARYKLTPNAPHLIQGVNFLLIFIIIVITKTYFYYFLLLLIIITFQFSCVFFFGCNSRYFRSWDN